MDPNYYTNSYYPNNNNPQQGNPPMPIDPYAYASQAPPANPYQPNYSTNSYPSYAPTIPDPYAPAPTIPDPYGTNPYANPYATNTPYDYSVQSRDTNNLYSSQMPPTNAYNSYVPQTNNNAPIPVPISSVSSPILDPYASLQPYQFPPGTDPYSSQLYSSSEYDSQGSSQPSVQEEETPVIQGKTKETGGLLGKLALKVGQVSGTATSLVTSKANNLVKRMTYETNLVSPPGGYVESDWEHLTKCTKFTNRAEIEFLYYEFKSHITIPKPGSKVEFKAIMTYDQFYNMLPRTVIPGTEEHFKLLVQSLYTVFKWGANEITFESFTKAMSIICRGSPAEKLPLLYDIIMDPYQRIATPESTRFTLNQIANLGLSCPSAGNAVPSPQDVDSLVMSVFPSNMPAPLAQFTDTVLSGMNNPYNSRAYSILMDCFGLFPFFFYQYFEPAEQFAHNLESASGKKPHKEGFLIKHHKGTVVDGWNNHWAVVDGGFLYYYPSNNQFNQAARVIFLGEASVRKSTLPSDPPFCFELSFGEKRKFCAQDDEHLDLWINVINISISQAKFSYHSFAPPREGISAQWFIDGKDTYSAMADALESATEEIFITDWFFSPQVFMRRYNDNGQPEMKLQNRLDFILKKKADQGVKVYVLPWSETKIAIDLASANVKTYLESLHPNIKVLCHPLMYPIKWSHHQKTIIVDQKIAFVGGLDTCFGRWDDQHHEVTDIGAVQRFPGKDYYNPGIREFANVQEPRTDLLNRNCEPRMPWHDIHMRCDGDAARDVATNFIQRWNHHHIALSQHKPIIPKFSFMHKTGNACVQVVRSVCDWSAGVNVTESSIYNAYIEEIEKAEHFIYIENQFFISATAGSPVENQISVAILNKVRAAVREKRTFRVIVIVPVHPEGGYKDTMTVRYIMGWQYKTVCKGASSMVEAFRREFPGVDVYEYFNFYVVKNWGRLGENLVAEQIYVHAKLMIIDDKTVITGSANINDRSMLGTRDSEIAVVIKDRTLIDSKMNGVDYKVTKFAHDLRVNLYLEHLGLTSADYYRVQDPICNDAYQHWLTTARANTEIYNRYFFKSFYYRYSPEAENDLRKIRGHLMEYDQNFLADDEMRKTITNVDLVLAGDDTFV